MVHHDVVWLFVSCSERVTLISLSFSLNSALKTVSGRLPRFAYIMRANKHTCNVYDIEKDQKPKMQLSCLLASILSSCQDEGRNNDSRPRNQRP